MTNLPDVIDLAQIICRYSDRFHRVGETTHHAASPLGAWLLLALAGRAASGKLREELTAILGVEPATAASWAGRMLDTPHPAVACAMAAWARKGRDAERLASFLASLPASVERGVGIPPRSTLNAWARERTLGLIETFPLRPDARPSLLLANALATKVRWLTPFEFAPPTSLGARSEWSRALTRVLRAEGGEHHVELIARTAGAGDVAVHSAWSHNDLMVTSVVASPDVPAPAVIAAAHDIATRLARGDHARLSLHDLPLGETSIWNITERESTRSTPGERAESYAALLPAWEARSDHDLLGRELGFEYAAAVLAEIAGLPLVRLDATQSVMARYTRVGFQAAAVTAFGKEFGAALRRPAHGFERHAELRFGHPFAVVAVTRDDSWNRHVSAAGPWHGVPVFSAWVADPRDTRAEPDEALEDAEEPGVSRMRALWSRLIGR